MNHLHTTLPILSRYVVIAGVRKDIPLSAPLQSDKVFADSRIKTSAEVNKSYEANRHLPCNFEGCNGVRHTNKHGECIATRCTIHHRIMQNGYRKPIK